MIFKLHEKQLSPSQPEARDAGAEQEDQKGAVAILQHGVMSGAVLLTGCIIALYCC